MHVAERIFTPLFSSLEPPAQFNLKLPGCMIESNKTLLCSTVGRHPQEECCLQPLFSTDTVVYVGFKKKLLINQAQYVCPVCAIQTVRLLSLCSVSSMLIYRTFINLIGQTHSTLMPGRCPVKAQHLLWKKLLTGLMIAEMGPHGAVLLPLSPANFSSQST